jgi:hypothetical protein
MAALAATKPPLLPPKHTLIRYLTEWDTPKNDTQETPWTPTAPALTPGCTPISRNTTTINVTTPPHHHDPHHAPRPNPTQPNQRPPHKPPTAYPQRMENANGATHRLNSP